MTKTINEGVFTFMNQGGMMVPFVYNGWREETLASKETAYFLYLPEYILRFLTSKDRMLRSS